MQRRWWEGPRLHTDGDTNEERRASWLELFYDLVFVVVVAEVARYLADHPTPGGVVGYILLFVATWWAWIGGTFYAERFETSDISHRVIVFLQMLPVAAMAVFASDGLGADSAPFALAYAAVRFLICLMWLRGGWHNPPFRPVSNRYVAGFSISIVLFVVSAAVPPPWRFVLWGCGLLIDLLTPTTTFAAQQNLPRLSASHLPERFGLFVLIVLGEAIVGVIEGVAEQEHHSLATIGYGTLGLMLAFGLWWIYFDGIARRAPRLKTLSSFAWNYLHLPLVMSIAALGISMLTLLTEAPGSTDTLVPALLGGAVGVALISIGLIETTLDPDPEVPAHPILGPGLKILCGGLACAVGFAGPGLARPLMVVLLVVLVVLPVSYAAYVWFRSPTQVVPDGVASVTAASE